MKADTSSMVEAMLQVINVAAQCFGKTQTELRLRRPSRARSGDPHVVPPSNIYSNDTMNIYNQSRTESVINGSIRMRYLEANNGKIVSALRIPQRHASTKSKIAPKPYLRRETCAQLRVWKSRFRGKKCDKKDARVPGLSLNTHVHKSITSLGHALQTDALRGAHMRRNSVAVLCIRPLGKGGTEPGWRAPDIGSIVNHSRGVHQHRAALGTHARRHSPALGEARVEVIFPTPLPTDFTNGGCSHCS